MLNMTRDLAGLVPPMAGVHDPASDPTFRATTNQVLGAAIDLLGDPVSDPATITRTVVELLAFMQGDPSRVLSAVAVRYRDRIETEGAQVSQELQAARRAFVALDAWAEGTMATWSAALLDVDPAADMAAAQRFDRALEQGPSQLQRVLAAASLGDDMGKAITRLAEDAIASPDIKPDRAAMLSQFLGSQYPTEVQAARYFQAHLAEAWRQSGAIGNYIPTTRRSVYSTDPPEAA